jgi:hypothetical protein
MSTSIAVQDCLGIGQLHESDGKLAGLRRRHCQPSESHARGKPDKSKAVPSEGLLLYVLCSWWLLLKISDEYQLGRLIITAGNLES